MLENQFKTKIKLDHYIYSKENKFYMINKEISKINLDELNLKSIGLFLGKKEKEGFIPSQEASQRFNLQ